MGKEIKIIIADDNHNLCQMLQDYFQGQENSRVVGVANNGLKAWELIQTHEPDIIILDLVMPVLDGLNVLERINTQATMTRPKIIMITAFMQESLMHEAMMQGVDYFVLKPFDFDALNKRIRSLTQDMPASIPAQLSTSSPKVSKPGSEHNLFNEVTKILQQIGTPAHVRGYQYLRDAILMVVEDVSLLDAVTKKLYPGIAENNNTTPSRVERGIRHAIELSWERGNINMLKSIFGYSMNTEHQKPTNSEFIATLADRLRIMG